MRTLVACACAFALVCACPVAAQAPPVRPLGPITAVSTAPLKSVAAAIQVSGGRIYVNDITARRLLLFDSTFADVTVVLDSSAAANGYGNGPGALLRFSGDSVLFIAPLTLSMLVLSPNTGIVRVLATPSTVNPMALLGSVFGTPAFDSRHRLVYFEPAAFSGFSGSSSNAPIEPADSAFIVRFDLTARTLDTAASIRIPRMRSAYGHDDEGRVISLNVTAFPPMPIDDWAVAEDGAITVVRGRDYHVDLLNRDGTWTAGARLPYEWERLDDDGKRSLIDSAATALEVIFDTVAARMRRAGRSGILLGRRTLTEQDLESLTFERPVRVLAAPGAQLRPNGLEQRNHANRALIEDVADYKPAFTQGAVRADRSGNLWIRTNKLARGQPVYDVVNRAGQLVDRVQLPPFRTIAGFGLDAVYIAVRDSSGVVHVERASTR